MCTVKVLEKMALYLNVLEGLCKASFASSMRRRVAGRSTLFIWTSKQPLLEIQHCVGWR